MLFTVRERGSTHCNYLSTSSSFAVATKSEKKSKEALNRHLIMPMTMVNTYGQRAQAQRVDDIEREWSSHGTQ